MVDLAQVMPDIPDGTLCAFGFKSQRWVTRILRACLGAGIRPKLLFTVGHRGRYIVAVAPSGLFFYLRVSDLRRGFFDSTFTPEFFSRKLKNEALNALRDYAADVFCKPLRLRYRPVQ